MSRIRWRRVLGASVVAYMTAIASLTILFGNPFIERILFTDEAGQSEKVLSVFLQQEPLPAVTPFWDQLGEIEARGFAVQGMLLVWAFAVVIVYAVAWAERPGSRWWRGASFGIAVWAVLFLFFEAYVPFNILGEPFPLVLVELSLQLIAMVATGLAIALVYQSSRTVTGEK